MIPVIAIDGPAGSGKGTMARKLASHFGFVHLDTGLLYRAAAFFNINEEELCNLSVEELLFKIKYIPDEILRGENIGMKASQLGQNSDVRQIMLRMQREFAFFPGEKYLGSVLDGRDIGTVVIPDAPCKLFITANINVRALRRFEAIKQYNIHVTFREIFEQLSSRDTVDTSRADAPLKCDDSYFIIDTSDDGIDESLAKAINIVEQSFERAGIVL